MQCNAVWFEQPPLSIDSFVQGPDTFASGLQKSTGERGSAVRER
jgi:hypothetical protein